MKPKEKLIQEIVKELKNMPDAYVKKVYGITQALQTHISVKKTENNSDGKIWEQVIDEINQIREQHQQVFPDKTERSFT